MLLCAFRKHNNGKTVLGNKTKNDMKILENCITSAIIIDDHYDEVENLDKLLKSLGIYVEFHNYSGDFHIEGEGRLKNRNLIFMDLMLNGNSGQLRENISIVISLLGKITNGGFFGAYGLVVWTSHCEYVEELKEALSKAAMIPTTCECSDEEEVLIESHLENHDMEKQVDALISCIDNDNFDSVKSIALNLEHIIAGYTVFLKKSSIRTTNVSTIVSAVIDNTKFRFSDHRIKVYSNRKSVSFEAKLSQTESIGALTNLIDNSIYWVSQSRHDDRKIYVYITDEIEGYISIVVCDNGCGFKLPPEQALRPFITGKPLNTGMGLGLHIAHEVMQAMKGKLLILDANEINLPDTAKKYQIDKAIVALCFPKA